MLFQKFLIILYKERNEVRGAASRKVYQWEKSPGLVGEAEEPHLKPSFISVFGSPPFHSGVWVWISPLEAATKRQAINPPGTNGYHDIGMHGSNLPLPHQAILTRSNQFWHNTFIFTVVIWIFLLCSLSLSTTTTTVTTHYWAKQGNCMQSSVFAIRPYSLPKHRRALMCILLMALITHPGPCIC